MPTSLITGANRGIGLELTRALASRGDTVIAACRKTSAELDELGVRVEAGIDVADAASVAKLATRLADVELDLLVNNAGILRTDRLEPLEPEAIRQQFEVNALGPLRVTAALLPRLRRGAKLVLVTSRMGSIGDNTSGGRYGYRMSKAALNMAGVSLAHDLKPRGIAVAIVHPGMVATDMTAGLHDAASMQRADDTAEKLVARIDQLSMENTGTFWHANGEVLPW